MVYPPYVSSNRLPEKSLYQDVFVICKMGFSCASSWGLAKTRDTPKVGIRRYLLEKSSWAITPDLMQSFDELAIRPILARPRLALDSLLSDHHHFPQTWSNLRRKKKFHQISSIPFLRSSRQGSNFFLVLAFKVLRWFLRWLRAFQVSLGHTRGYPDTVKSE